MKKTILFLLLSISSQLFSQVQQSFSSYDSKFFDKLKWRNIGPARGGRSLGAAGSPGRINEYYFGATGGGLWKT
ncbi:MAG TPA: hypothetical protein VGQ59_19500, partial [Cyclobacteriaceae bacterium]|nr:hypothetical protein [Cyclobacteriaceae bacterium]